MYSLNFTGVSKGFVVSKAPVTVQVSGTQTYGGSPSFSYTTTPSGMSITSLKCTTVGSSSSISSSLAAGTYTILGSSCSGARLELHPQLHRDDQRLRRLGGNANREVHFYRADERTGKWSDLHTQGLGELEAHGCHYRRLFFVGGVLHQFGRGGELPNRRDLFPRRQPGRQRRLQQRQPRSSSPSS